MWGKPDESQLQENKWKLYRASLVVTNRLIYPVVHMIMSFSVFRNHFKNKTNQALEGLYLCSFITPSHSPSYFSFTPYIFVLIPFWISPRVLSQFSKNFCDRHCWCPVKFCILLKYKGRHESFVNVHTLTGKLMS